MKYGCLAYEIINNEAKITCCITIKSGRLEIPEKLSGYPVTAIEDHAFLECDKLETLIIPDSVTSIGKGAFFNCRNLKYITLPKYITKIRQYTFTDCAFQSITIPEGVTEIEDCAFSLCRQLKNIHMSKALKRIGYRAFDSCFNLTDVTIPNSVDFIAEGAFSGCPALQKISVEKNSLFYTSIDGSLYTKDKTKLLTYAASDDTTVFKIPNGVTAIANYAFKDCGKYLIGIIIPNSVTSIGAYAFADCENISYINLPDSLTYIGKGAFQNCNSLQEITLPKNLDIIEDELFSECYNLKKINVDENNPYYTSVDGVLYDKYITRLIAYPPDGNETYEVPEFVNEIADSAFKNCNFLAKISLPDTLELIGNQAFSDCYALKSIKIPDNVVFIGYSAFSSCSELTEVSIPNNLYRIEDNTFYGCQSLKYAAIPDSVCSIGKGAFSECPALQKIIVEKSNLFYTSIDGSLYTKSETELLIYAAPETITHFEIPKGVTTINYCAFQYRGKNLANIIVPDSVTSIGDYAFADCENLTRITLPCSLTYIGEGAFADCSSLKEIKIPENVRYLDDNAFYGCYRLKSIEVDERNPFFKSVNGVLYDKNMTTLIHYPSEKSETEFVVPEGITSISDWAFTFCSNLRTIKIPKSVASVGFGNTDFTFEEI